ncbi:sugar kinase [Arthrobacter sp. Soil782]|uniref:sugar kinase n=1 Tax=Arthrobacter sp. Soil782 TaxID=1736410 RepID=UPI0006F7F2A9|nr:sugar kinase [Arthrobacter sp. Soil782]KRF06342.1 sugar kinase [Arthrobacter sp. Soil782]
MTDVITFGETMALMKAATPGPLAHVPSLDLGIGGAESNVAIALCRLGTSVMWAGRIGADSLGDLVLRELNAEGIQVKAVTDTTAPTGLMIKERRTPDAMKVWYYRSGSAGSKLDRNDIPVEEIASAKLLHITGITPALSASAAEAVRFAVQSAREAETPISFDLNYRAALWSAEDAGMAFRDIITQVDLVFAGDDEARLVVQGEDAAELARKLTDLGPKQAVVKRGERGAVAHIDGADYQVPAVAVRVVDTVGAGDAFVAGYLSEFLRGATPTERLTTAARVGAFACTVPGDWEGNPRRSELSLLNASEPVRR